jgi:hypothetical protein
MGDVVKFPGLTRLDIPAKRVLQEALKANLETVIISGFTEDGEIYTVSSSADGGNALWLAEQFKRALLNAADEIAEG